jgi:single-strand DNA-binding protein
MNDVKMIGRLSKEPKSLDTETDICVFDIAVDRKKKNADGSRKVDFFSCKAFGSLAKFASQHLEKGERIAISGRLTNEPWVDKFDQPRISAVIVLREIDFADGRKQQGKDEPTEPTDLEEDERTPG